VDEVMLRERSLCWVMIPAYGLTTDEEDPEAKGWERGEVRAEVEWGGS